MTNTTQSALIFDCDGVLIDSEYLASRVESEQLHALGIELGVEEAHALFLGKTVDGVLDAIAARSGTRPGSSWVYNWAFATAHAFMRELKAVAGVGIAIEALRRRGHRMAVASQSPLARVQLSLQVAGLAGQFGQHIYVTSMVARPKPAPDVYLLAAQRLGAEPAECIVIEDSPASAASALAAGMRVIGYAPGNTFDAMRASGASVIRSMDELIARIDSAQ
ncbi:MAG TPA: HAD family phosphatase [Steroidobacteraceae bacterium]|nr:HAD family phosphatase [Steroidobacteraceae bacterium]